MENVKINLDNLIAFLFVAKEKSFSGAATKLFLTQPAVTTKIKCLESQFGGKLFTTTGKDLQLTDLAREVLPTAEEIYREVKEIESMASSYRDTIKGVLRIGASRSLSQTYVPLLISMFTEQCPGVQISVTEGYSHDVIEKILEFKDEIGVIPRVQVSDKLIAHTISRERMELVVGSSHRLAKKERLSIHDILQEPILLAGVGSATRLTFLEIFEKYHVTPRIALEAENIEMTKKYLFLGKGLGLLYPPLMKEELGKGLLKTLTVEGLDIFIDVQLVYLARRVLSSSAKKFMEIAVSTFGPRNDLNPLDSLSPLKDGAGHGQRP
jgi:DNA-binding transcriptional LysR family regulator